MGRNIKKIAESTKEYRNHVFSNVDIQILDLSDTLKYLVQTLTKFLPYLSEKTQKEPFLTF